MKDWTEVEAFALTLPGTSASTFYRQPAVKVDGKAFISTGHEPGSFHVRAAHDEKAVLIETDPDTFWQTAHYASWPGLLVRYGATDPERVMLVIRRAWWDLAKPATRKLVGETALKSSPGRGGGARACSRDGGGSAEVTSIAASPLHHSRERERFPSPSRGGLQNRFTDFACFDWSGQNVARPKGIALAIADREGPPTLIHHRWSRDDVLAWLKDIAARREPMLIGLDLSPGFPLADAGAYFPDWPDTPADAKALWALVDRLSAADSHLCAAGFLAHPQVARYFRQHGGRQGDRFGEEGRGRLRVCEAAQLGQLSPSSCFNLVGAAQVGKSSLTGMRILHRLGGAIPFWPFDPLPDDGPVLAEIYTTIAARAAGVANGRSKLRSAADLDRALAALGSPPHDPLDAYDDHATDALLTAAWLRANAARTNLWSPAALTPHIAATEGWTFGVS